MQTQEHKGGLEPAEIMTLLDSYANHMLRERKEVPHAFSCFSRMGAAG